MFAVNLPLKLFPATIANADIGSPKSVYTLFDKYLDHLLVKFEQNCMVQTARNFELLTKKPGFFKTIFDKAFDTTGNNEKVHSYHVTAIKFLG